MSKSEPSAWWYLVPIFFGIIGGIIGYYAIIGRNKRMAKSLLIVGIASTVIIVFLKILFAI